MARRAFNFCMSPLALIAPRHVIKVDTSGENAERTNSSQGTSGNGGGMDRLNLG